MFAQKIFVFRKAGNSMASHFYFSAQHKQPVVRCINPRRNSAVRKIILFCQKFIFSLTYLYPGSTFNTINKACNRHKCLLC